jgi:hypothetical protein
VGDTGRARRLHHRQGARRRHQGAATRQVQVVCPDSTSVYLQQLPLELLPDFFSLVNGNTPASFQEKKIIPGFLTVISE